LRTVGIIVEYNPLHNGHVHHFAESKRHTGADAVVAVMSGHFLQRGEPALLNKWARTEMALRMGADLVIELPVAFSAQPAEWFAYGAVSALEHTGVVDALCFGSESGDIRWLRKLAGVLAREPESFQALVKQELKTGISYPKAYTAAVARLSAELRWDAAAEPPSAEAMSQPNNTLGLHYLIALERIHSRIEPFTIARSKAGYRQTEPTDKVIASATAIRKLLLETGSDMQSIEPYIPSYTAEIIQREIEAGHAPITWDSFTRIVVHRLLTSTPDRLAGIYEVTEGLEHRMIQAVSSVASHYIPSVEQLLDKMKTKRYTRTKLQRTLTRILLDHAKSDLPRTILRQGAPYLRILGFSAAGRQLLKRMKHTAAVPVITRLGNDIPSLLQLDVKAASAYALGYRSPTREDLLRDYIEPPIQL